MKKTFAYLALISFTIYFSLVLGKIIAGFDEDQTGNYPDYSESSNSHYKNHSPLDKVFEYLNPFPAFADITSKGNSEASPDEAYSSSSATGTGRGLALYEKERVSRNGISGGGGQGALSRETHHQKSEHLPSNSLYSFESTDILAMTNQASKQQASGNGGTGAQRNSTGIFGLRLAPPQTQGGAPPPPAVPLDSGSVFIIILGIAFGGFFLLKFNKKETKTFSSAS